MPATWETTNEELAVLAQAGDADAHSQLWAQSHRYIFKIMSKYRGVALRHGHDADDLEQSAYFAMLRAIKYYRPDDEYPFKSYLRHAAQIAFRDLVGWRVYKEKLPPAISLQTPVLWDGGEGELQDTILDLAAEMDFEFLEAEQTVKMALDQLEPPLQHIIYLRYWKEQGPKQISKDLGIDQKEIVKMEKSAMRALRHPQVAAPLAAFYGITYYAPVYYD